MLDFQFMKLHFPLVLRKLTNAKAMKKNHFTDRFKSFILFGVLFTGALLSCQESEKDVLKPKTVTDILAENERFSTIHEIIIGAKAQDAFRTTNGFTFFAPNNAAFENAGLSASQVLAFPKDSALNFIKYHVYGKQKNSADFKKEIITMLNKGTVEVSRGEDTTIITLNKNAVIVEKNIHADNGTIQVINRLLTKKL